LAFADREVTKVMARKIRFAGHRDFRIWAVVLTAALLMLPTHVARAQASSEGSGSGGSQPAAQSSAKPNLAGTWKLNKDQSDNPRQKMQQAMGGANGQPGGGGGANREPGAGRPGRGGGPGGMMAEWNQLTIEQTDTGVKVTGASGRVLATSQAPSKSENDNSAGTGDRRFPPAVATWQGSELVAKSQGFGGGTTTRTFELSPDGKQLYVTTKMENERLSQPVTYKLVYDPGKAGTNNQ
jgi:hypothetical protein